MKHKTIYRLQRRVFLYWQPVEDFTSKKQASKKMWDEINTGVPASLFRILEIWE